MPGSFGRSTREMQTNNIAGGQVIEMANVCEPVAMPRSIGPDFDVSDFAFDGTVAGYEEMLADLHYLRFRPEC